MNLGRFQIRVDLFFQAHKMPGCFQFVDELRKQPEWIEIPIVVVTAKDLTPDDRLRLNGHVGIVLQKGAYESEELLREAGRLVADRIRKVGQAVRLPTLKG